MLGGSTKRLMSSCAEEMRPLSEEEIKLLLSAEEMRPLSEEETKLLLSALDVKAQPKRAATQTKTNEYFIALGFCLKQKKGLEKMGIMRC